ncbi:MAG: hypothetical protein JSW11_15690 [Candidatus Heimdallarchaeota archaeon]|nr:MAG: hypothetical protein JSW11_15690 [Candidatus Heimdallarchaeota archaeon]
MGNTRIVAYQVQNDGFFDPVVFKKENLKSTEVYIFVEEGKKEIWIWIGEDADVRTRFISSRVASEIRGHYGITFRIKSADQGGEPDDFWSCIDSIPLEGIGPVEDFDKTPLSKIHSQAEAKLNKLIAPKAPILKAPKTKAEKKSPKNPPKTSPKKRKKDPPKTPTPLTDFIGAKPSLMTTPPCPRCEKGHLLPFSQLVTVSSRKKELLPFAKWACSNCGFSPKIENL